MLPSNQRLKRRLFSSVNNASILTDIAIVGGGPVGSLLALLLNKYNPQLRICLLEKRLVPTDHPQAHFINTRSLEILQTHLPSVHKKTCDAATSSKYWR